jgi:hypothetical protein
MDTGLEGFFHLKDREIYTDLTMSLSQMDEGTYIFGLTRYCNWRLVFVWGIWMKGDNEIVL